MLPFDVNDLAGHLPVGTAAEEQEVVPVFEVGPAMDQDDTSIRS